MSVLGLKDFRELLERRNDPREFPKIWGEQVIKEITMSIYFYKEKRIRCFDILALLQ